MTFSSDEVNFLVYRYLEESGFHHSAYLFGTESNVFNAGIDATMVPKGALLSIIQKGIFFTEAELFSIFSDTDLDAKLEKSVGSMTLIESIMPDGVRQKAMEIRSPQCTPRAGTSTTNLSANDRSSLPPSRTPQSIPSTSDGPSINPSGGGGTTTSTHDKQIKRERDMRAQQVMNNLIVSSNSPSANSGSSVPRGFNRHDLKPTISTPSIATTSAAAYGSSLPTAAMAPTPSGQVTSSGFVHLGQGVPSSITTQFNHLQHSVSAAMIGVAAPTSNGVLPSSTSSSSNLIQMERERESREASANRYMPNGHHGFSTAQGNTRVKQLHLGGTNVGGGGGAIGSGTGGGGGGAQVAANTAGSLTSGSVFFGNRGVTFIRRNDKLLPRIDGIDPEIEIDRDNVLYPKGHSGEVFTCAWNPRSDLISTGSGDGTARIWTIPRGDFRATSANVVEKSSVLLKHSPSLPLPAPETSQMASNKDVTSMDWSSNGDHLATGSYNGYTRVWDTNGKLLCTLGAHKGPIFALKWNRRGDRILSAGVDKATIVWDPVKVEQVQQFLFHSSSTLDIDWITDDTFASCSTDHLIHICKIGYDRPLKTFKGHANEVNAIKYDPETSLLASCSDDRTLKIWSLNYENPIFDVSAHDLEINTIRWSPKGRIIASASFDKSVKIWDVENRSLLRTLLKHTEPVYSIAFSPDGKFLASGSLDRCVHVWDVQTGQLVLSHTGDQINGGIFEVGWNHSGDKIAASASDGTLILCDVRYIKNRYLGLL
uniref:LisH domain-containing protein n=1 Tax=Acrobeloides nanus TaxID=290746 RepID=A0A914D8B0_9BILA